MDNVIDSLRHIDWNFPEAKPSAFGAIHPYPVKFINEIPAHLIDMLAPGKDEVIVAPFCGSGVTLEEA